VEQPCTTIVIYVQIVRNTVKGRKRRRRNRWT
jgi:hypothetical protein